MVNLLTYARSILSEMAVRTNDQAVKDWEPIIPGDDVPLSGVTTYRLENGLYHHVYDEEEDGGVTHALSFSANPRDNKSVVATVANIKSIPGVETFVGPGSKDRTEFAFDFPPHHWGSEDEFAIEHHSATAKPYRGRGYNPLLRHEALKHHFRVVSDTSISGSSQAAWKKFGQKPGVFASLSQWPEPEGLASFGNPVRHWAEYHGQRKIPYRVHDLNGDPMAWGIDPPSAEENTEAAKTRARHDDMFGTPEPEPQRPRRRIMLPPRQ